RCRMKVDLRSAARQVLDDAHESIGRHCAGVVAPETRLVRDDSRPPRTHSHDRQPRPEKYCPGETRSEARSRRTPRRKKWLARNADRVQAEVAADAKNRREHCRMAVHVVMRIDMIEH